MSCRHIPSIQRASGEGFVVRSEALIAKGHATRAHALLLRMLDPEPRTRITVDECLRHEYFTEGERACTG